jgi:hypothetical protein
MRKVVFAVLLASAALACSKSDSSNAAPAQAGQMAGDKGEAKLAELTVEEVDTQIAAHQLTAVDVNGDGTRKKMGVVPGAILLSDDESFAASELPADKSTKLVFYCRNES